jgi:hypothetical protein
MARRLNEFEALIQLGEMMERRPELVVEIAANLLRVRDKEGKLRRLVANAAQRRFEERRGRQNIVLKARQIGMTTWVAGRFFLRTITRPGTLTLQVAHTREAAEAIFGIVQRMWEELPVELREGPLVRSRANAGLMVFPELDSEFRVASASDGNAGRGLSVQNLHCSEMSRWPSDAAETLAGLRAALAPGGELVLESTPSGAYGAFYEEWRAGVEWGGGGDATHVDGEAVAMNGAPGDVRRGGPGAPSGGAPRGRAGDGGEDRLVRHFLPWWMERAYAGPAVAEAEWNEDERLLVQRQGLTGAQIGFRRGLERSYGGLRSQEFAEDAETCFRATGASCFDIAAIERRLAEAPGELQRRNGGALLVWLPAIAGREYVVAVDSAGGGEEGDFAAVQVVELMTGLQCAELQQRLRPAELARAAAELAREYCGALVAVERNNHGAAVLAYLETNERYGRMYRQGGEAGWLTTAASKPEAIARIGSMLEQTPERFMSRRLLGECRTFVSGERGSMSAAGGAHDDLVMAMAIAQAVRAERLGARR